MNTYPPTPTPRSHRRRASRSAMVGLCLVALAAQAAEPLLPTITAKAAEPASLFSLIGLKERLFRLRDATLVAVAPVREDTVNFDAFDANHQLFRPLVSNVHEKRLLDNQPDGLQLRSNLLFQYELVRYQTVSPNTQLGVRLGLHYEFR